MGYSANIKPKYNNWFPCHRHHHCPGHHHLRPNLLQCPSHCSSCFPSSPPQIHSPLSSQVCKRSSRFLTQSLPMTSHCYYNKIPMPIPPWSGPCLPPWFDFLPLHPLVIRFWPHWLPPVPQMSHDLVCLTVFPLAFPSTWNSLSLYLNVAGNFSLFRSQFNFITFQRLSLTIFCNVTTTSQSKITRHPVT